MTDRKPLISGNWKMHHNHFEALQLVQKLSYLLTKADYDAADVSVHPPFTDLRTVQTYFISEKEPIPIALGAQNCHTDEKGAFTGEIAAPMLAKLEVRYVIAGHSERRQLFGETDELVNAKAHAILKAGMTPIICCGETLEEREAGGTEEKVTGQVEAALVKVAPAQVGGLVIAYEPIWAIGTGRTASAEDAQAVCSLVRSTVARTAGSEAAASVRVQYGGSVNPTNAAELLVQPDVDGALVGGLVIAYEPIWAIGTGRTASPEDAQAVCSLVRATVAGTAGSEAAASVRVQYGGSVNPTNAAELLAQPDIDGALVGGASLLADDFARIVQSSSRSG